MYSFNKEVIIITSLFFLTFCKKYYILFIENKKGVIIAMSEIMYSIQHRTYVTVYQIDIEKEEILFRNHAGHRA